MNAEMVMKYIRTRRNKLLACTDWTQLPPTDGPTLSDDDRNIWREYRQKLRDLPLSINIDALIQNDNLKLDDIAWPVIPFNTYY